MQNTDLRTRETAVLTHMVGLKIGRLLNLGQMGNGRRIAVELYMKNVWMLALHLQLNPQESVHSRHSNTWARWLGSSRC